MYLNWKEIFSIGTLEALGHRVSIRDGVLKMTRSSKVVLKDVWCNNLYYLMGSTVTGWMTTSISSVMFVYKFDIWGSNLQEKSLCKFQQKRNHWKVYLPTTWNWVDTMFWTRRRRWISVPLLTAQKVVLIVFTLVFRDLPRLHRLEVIVILSLLLIIYLGIVRYIPWDKYLKP